MKEEFRLGDLVVRRDGGTLIRVGSVGMARRVTLMISRMDEVFAGAYIHDGQPRIATDLPIRLYRRATPEEIEDARTRGTLPPEVVIEPPPFGF